MLYKVTCLVCRAENNVLTPPVCVCVCPLLILDLLATWFTTKHLSQEKAATVKDLVDCTLLTHSKSWQIITLELAKDDACFDPT